uniref:Uncharacterized protein n=1 Tax=Pinguiococcus pyrenoidosus TaxID=172671 RepID=A0A7R9U6V6_9STRA|mmetsp:Transcript_17353/g.66107  ORF Transcript_17353/g.66107 Transcript_17353/m.66107 type:complete len:357 (+) Transcript_17353:134-1204(+)
MRSLSILQLCIFCIAVCGFHRRISTKLRVVPHDSRFFSREVSLRAVWSNPQAVEDYQNYLDGVEEQVSKDQPSVFVAGSDRRLAEGLASFGFGKDVVISSIKELPASVDGLTDFPIYACVAPMDLEQLILDCPEAKRPDLVFLQTGMMEPLLKRYGLCGKRNTQALCYFEFHPMSGKPIDYVMNLGLDQQGNDKLAAVTSVCGKWAGAMTQRLTRNNIYCEAVGYYEWRRVMLERVLFETIFSLVGALHKDSTFGEVGLYYKDEVEEMWTDFNRCIRGHLAVTMLYGVEERFYAIAESFQRHGDRRRAIGDDWPFFHGYWMEVDRMYTSKGLDPPVPMWREYMDYGVYKNIFTLPS